MPRKDENKGRREAAAQKKRAALQYRLAGMPYRHIGEKVGVSHQQAFKYVRSALQEIRDATKETTEELIQMESERLDGARMAIAPRVLINGDLPAIDRWVRISESYRALLGLDAPMKKALTTPDGQSEWQPFQMSRDLLERLEPDELAEYERLMAKMVGDNSADLDDEEEDEEAIE